MLKVLIVEDENKEACMLQDCIKLTAPDLSIVGIAENLKQAKKLIDETNPDLVFFDVELPDGHSFDLLAKLPEIKFGIIFTTAHSKYAVNAFQFSAIDFVLKPITVEDIDAAIKKAKTAIFNKQMSDRIDVLLHNHNKTDEEKKIILQSSDTIHFVSMKDIIHCQSDNNYTQFFLINGNHIMVSKTIKDFEQMLPQTIFFRSHQSHIVNLNYIQKIKKRTLEIILSNGDTAYLATRKKDQLLEVMKRQF